TSSSRRESVRPIWFCWAELARMDDTQLLDTPQLAVEIACRGLEADGDSFGNAAPHRRVQIQRWRDDTVAPITSVVLIAGHVDEDEFQLVSAQAQPLQTNIHAV